MTGLKQLVDFLDQYLELDKVRVEPTNGLQVVGTGDIKKIALAVDPCIPVIEQSISWGAQLLLTHHPLIHDPWVRVSLRDSARLKVLLPSNMSLYCAHLVLDRHPKVGNAVTLAKLIGLQVKGEFGTHNGIKVGCWTQTDPLPFTDFVARVRDKLSGIQAYPHGPALVQKVGIVTGYGGDQLPEAAALGLDTFITGSASHHEFLDSQELKINIIFGGHYATEQFGVQELGNVLENKFTEIEVKFFPYPTGL